MIRVLIVEEADAYDHEAWKEADVIIRVNSTSVDDMAEPEIDEVICNTKPVMRKDMAELIGDEIAEQLGV